MYVDISMFNDMKPFAFTEHNTGVNVLHSEYSLFIQCTDAILDNKVYCWPVKYSSASEGSSKSVCFCVFKNIGIGIHPKNPKLQARTLCTAHYLVKLPPGINNKSYLKPQSQIL